MSRKHDALRMFKEGKGVKEVAEVLSRPTAYRYLRLFLLIEIKEELSWLIDSEGWTRVSVPQARAILKEVREI